MLESYFTRLFSYLHLCDGSIINSNTNKTASEENKGSMSLHILNLVD